MAPAQPAPPPPGMRGHSEGHSQFLTRVVAAEWEGSTKLTIKAAKAAGNRCPWEPQAPSLDSTVMATVVILAAAPSPKVLPSRTLHEGPSYDKSVCVLSCHGPHPATRPSFCSVYRGPAGSGKRSASSCLPGRAGQGSRAAREAGTAMPA